MDKNMKSGLGGRNHAESYTRGVISNGEFGIVSEQKAGSGASRHSSYVPVILTWSFSHSQALSTVWQRKARWPGAGDGVRILGCLSLPFVTMWPWANHFLSLLFNFLTCKKKKGDMIWCGPYFFSKVWILGRHLGLNSGPSIYFWSHAN